MKTPKIVLISMLAVMIAFSLYASSSHFVSAKGISQKVRVIAESDDKVTAAVEHGCQVVRETRGLKALLCDSDIASSLGLQEDVRVFAVDSGANSQIGATTVQSNGYDGTGR